MLLSPRKFLGILECRVENQGQKPAIKRKDVLVSLSLEVIQVLGALRQELRTETKHIPLIMSQEVTPGSGTGMLVSGYILIGKSLEPGPDLCLPQSTGSTH